MKGGYPGSGGYQTPQQGGYPGQAPGGYPGQAPGGYPGQVPGGYPGQAPQGGYPGYNPGSQPGSHGGYAPPPPTGKLGTKKPISVWWNHFLENSNIIFSVSWQNICLKIHES